MNRISVVGTSGSGKTTFSGRLSKALGLPHVELDSVFWKDNWVESSREEMIEKTLKRLEQPQWIIDGNYSYLTHETWSRADLIIWLDTPKLWNLWAVSKRSILRAFTREKLFGTNCRESLHKFFLTKNSMFWWVWSSYDRRKERFEREFKSRAMTLQTPMMVRFKKHREMEIFIETLARTSALIEKVQAYVVRDRSGKKEVLVFRHPIWGSIEVVRGTVEANEPLDQAVVRELYEEAGISLNSRPQRFAWGSRFLQGGESWDGPWEHQLRHAFYFDGSSIEKDAWSHRVTGGGSEEGLEFQCFWMSIDQLDSKLSVGSQMFIHDLEIFLNQTKEQGRPVYQSNPAERTLVSDKAE